MRQTTAPTGASEQDEMLTIRQVLRLLGNVPESTFYRWRRTGKGPRAIKLPNGAVRIRRSEFDRWIGSLEETA
ncbi:helix-turn-helix transcriptional regulator [Streptomyces cacaoi]|uniref:helix-turn-helix transcriptional regulator n=1 Tax=Streptomyces cacaoi TaxID=1898 RepID=UPI00260795A9|nr:helix-turn-helix domain-containing protein [Streptomyces cacaoi]